MQATPRKTKKGGFFSIDEGESVNDGKRALFHLEKEDREGGFLRDKMAERRRMTFRM